MIETAPNPARAWELKSKAEQGTISTQENEELRILQENCTVNHGSPAQYEVDKGNCTVCGTYLG